MAVLNLSGIQEQQLMFKQSSVDGTEVPGSEEEALSWQWKWSLIAQFNKAGIRGYKPM